MVKVVLRNMGKAPKGCHDKNGQSVMVDPGKEREADLTETMVNFLSNADSDLVVIIKGDQGADAPTKPEVQKSGVKDSKKPGKAIPIPADWPNLGWNARRKLAMEISGGKVSGGAHANSIIEAELERQASL